MKLTDHSGTVELSIGDDGDGFGPQKALPDQLGLSIMRERAKSIGATLEINSKIGDGTQITITWSGGGPHDFRNDIGNYSP